MQEFSSNPVVTAVRRALAGMDVSPDARILAGVSGGVDSMVLLHVLKNLNFPVSAVHVNFQLRGEESDLDASHVKNWCAQNEIPYIEFAIDTRSYSVSNKVNIQTAARDIRYNLWKEMYASGKFDFIATAHHHDDAVETMLMNLLRGTGMKGLTGIPMKRDFYIRPLLRVSRSQVEQYALDFNIPFRTDVSNESDQYFRNRIRHHLIPTLIDLSSNPEKIMDHTLHRIRIEWESWESAYKEWELTYIVQDGEGFILKEQPGKSSFLLRWLEEKGIPWQLAFDYIHANHSQGGKVLKYGHISITRIDEGFYFEKMADFKEVIIDNPGIYPLGDHILEIRHASREEFQYNDDSNVEYIDADKLSWPLTCRNVLPGDHFYPLGMNGHSKKLQDFLVDLKLEQYEKNRIFLLLSSDQVVWVIGRRLDERFSVTPQSENLIRMEWSKTEKTIRE